MQVVTIFLSLLALTFLNSSQAVKISGINTETPNVKHNANAKKAVQAKVSLIDCNVNVCFAIDGSQSVGPRGFRIQQDIVTQLAAIIDNKLSATSTSAFAATQYGLVNSDVSLLTTDLSAFQGDVEAAVFQNADSTFMSAGVSFCVNQLNEPELTNGKIVVLGDANANFGDLDGPLSPASIVSDFIAGGPNRAVCGIAPPSSVSQMATVLGLSSDVVFSPSPPEGLDEIADSILEAICN